MKYQVGIEHISVQLASQQKKTIINLKI